VGWRLPSGQGLLNQNVGTISLQLNLARSHVPRSMELCGERVSAGSWNIVEQLRECALSTYVARYC
jgi:hypothetical protein